MEQPRKPAGSPGATGGQYDTVKGGGTGDLPALSHRKQVKEERAYYAEYSKYLELSLVHDKTTHILIAILRDVTVEEEERLKKEEIGRQTVEIADRVVEKQMRIVQEIASLLGETTAETKIALTKLKESINSEETR